VTSARSQERGRRVQACLKLQPPVIICFQSTVTSSKHLPLRPALFLRSSLSSRSGLSPQGLAGMDWFKYARQAVLDSVSNLIPDAQLRSQYSSIWKSHGKLNLKSLAQASLLASSSAGGQPGGTSASCPNAQLSCHNTSAADTCCLNHPGGLMLQTQFWDTNPPVGPSDSWTVHGLWSVLPTSMCKYGHLILA
jgi:hypothetical protein